MHDEWMQFPRRCQTELSQFSFKATNIERLSWWPAFQQRKTNVEPLATEIDSWSDRETEVCFAHGEFTNANMQYTRESIWVFDWEDSAPDAPVMTDEVGFFLGNRTRSTINKPIYVADMIRRHFLVGSGEAKKRNVAMALAYLCSRDNRSAIILVKQWPRIVGQSNVG